MPWSDQQMDTMGNLAFLQFMHTRKDPLPAHELSMGFPESNDKKIQRLLDWISTAFVREDRGDTVAAALATTHGSVTLYLAANRGRPTAEDKAFGDQFLQQLRVSMDKFMRNDPRSKNPLLQCVMEFTSERFIKKLDMIKDMKRLSATDTSPHDVGARFSALVTRPTQSNTPVVEDKVLVNFAHKSFQNHPARPKSDPDGRATLIFLFIQLLSSIKKKTKKPEKFVFKPESRALEALSFAVLAKRVASANFFKAITKPTEDFTMEEVFWLRKLKRRLWRVAHYVVDAALLQSDAFPMFQKVLGDKLPSFLANGEGFNIVWVGDDHTALPNVYQWDAYQWPPYKWPGPPLPRFRQLLEHHKVSDELLDDADFMEGVKDLWQEKVEVRLHCEIQLVNYLERENINIIRNMVGVSKLSCYPCSEYLDRVNSDRGSARWVVSGCSNKSFAGWLVPDDPRGTQVVQIIRAKVGEDLRVMLEQARRKRSNSGGSDTSGGSRTAQPRSPTDIDDDDDFGPTWSE